MPRKETDVLFDTITARNKSGNTRYSLRKVAKVNTEDELTKAELEWCKAYAVVLKTVNYSNRYISDTIRVRTGLVKEWLDQPEAQERMAVIQQDLVSGAIDHLKNSAIDLAEMLIELARSTSDDAVKLKAILAGLDRVGMAAVNKSESSVTKTERQEHDLSVDFFDKLESLPLETQTQIADLMGQVEQIVTAAKGHE